MKWFDNLVHEIKKKPLRALIGVMIITAMIWYGTMPIDLLPDAVPFAGYIDDGIFILFGLYLINDIFKTRKGRR